jgi:hypothetical protein
LKVGRGGGGCLGNGEGRCGDHSAGIGHPAVFGGQWVQLCLLLLPWPFFRPAGSECVIPVSTDRMCRKLARSGDCNEQQGGGQWFHASTECTVSSMEVPAVSSCLQVSTRSVVVQLCFVWCSDVWLLLPLCCCRLLPPTQVTQPGPPQRF